VAAAEVVEDDPFCSDPEPRFLDKVCREEGDDGKRGETGWEIGVDKQEAVVRVGEPGAEFGAADKGLDLGLVGKREFPLLGEGEGEAGVFV
jgi:hypothetical protein